MNALLLHSRTCVLPVLLIVMLAPGLITPAGAADIEMEGYLGETITLHGVSYVGDYVYLFMTGPGLPENGVTLTNTALRADQGQFTVVGVEDNQEWSYSWKTSRIASEIDPGTYTVYVTNEKADLSHLGGSSSYKTLSVFLKDSGVSKVSIGAEHVYTLSPEEHVSTVRPAPSVNITAPAVTATPPTAIAVETLPDTSAVPATTARSAPGPVTAAAALACGAGLVLIRRHHR